MARVHDASQVHRDAPHGLVGPQRNHLGRTRDRVVLVAPPPRPRPGPFDRTTTHTRTRVGWASHRGIPVLATRRNCVLRRTTTAEPWVSPAQRRPARTCSPGHSRTAPPWRRPRAAGRGCCRCWPHRPGVVLRWAGAALPDGQPQIGTHWGACSLARGSALSAGQPDSPWIHRFLRRLRVTWWTRSRCRCLTGLQPAFARSAKTSGSRLTVPTIRIERGSPKPEFAPGPTGMRQVFPHMCGR